MKKFLIATLIFVYSLICLDINAKTYIDDSPNKPNIEQIIVNIPSTVSLYSGDKFGYNIRTKDIDLYKLIKTEIIDKKLIIEFNDYRLLEDDYNYIDPNSIKINIEVPQDIKIKTNSERLVAVTKTHKATNHENN